MTSVVDLLDPNVVPIALRFREDDPGFLVLEARAHFAMSEEYEIELTVQHREPSLAAEDFLTRACDVVVAGELVSFLVPCIVKRMRQMSINAERVSRYLLGLVRRICG